MCIFNLSRSHGIVFPRDSTNLHSIGNRQKFLLLHTFTTFGIVRLSSFCQSLGCMMIFYCGSNFQFSDCLWDWALFHISWPFRYSSSKKGSLKPLPDFFWWVFCLALTVCEISLNILHVSALPVISVAMIFFSNFVIGLSFYFLNIFLQNRVLNYSVVIFRSFLLWCHLYLLYLEITKIFSCIIF